MIQDANHAKPFEQRSADQQLVCIGHEHSGWQLQVIANENLKWRSAGVAFRITELLIYIYYIIYIIYIYIILNYIYL